jgi:hypothetical protein
MPRISLATSPSRQGRVLHSIWLNIRVFAAGLGILCSGRGLERVLQRLEALLRPARECRAPRVIERLVARVYKLIRPQLFKRMGKL